MTNYILKYILIFTFCAGKLFSEVMIGDGPDSTCGGSILKVVDSNGKIKLIQNTLFLSSKTIVEQFKLNSDLNWTVTIFVHSARWINNETIKPENLISTYSFKISDEMAGNEISRKLGFKKTKWRHEPERFIKYYKINKDRFKKEVILRSNN